MLAPIRLTQQWFRSLRMRRGGPKSLRLRLVLLSGTLVAVVALALSALHVDSIVESLSSSAVKSSGMATNLVSDFLIQRIQEHFSDYLEPSTEEDARAIV